MSNAAPIEAIWDGEVFRPTSSYWARRADKQFAKGEILRLVDNPERSSASHNHYHASIQTAFGSLPPLMVERFNSPEALRKYALIKAGHCYSDSITCPSHADALRVASFVRGQDEFALVTVNKTMVTRFIPKSQSYRSMSKSEFQKSKDGVLRVIAEMLDVSRKELSDAGAAA